MSAFLGVDVGLLGTLRAALVRSADGLRTSIDMAQSMQFGTTRLSSN